MNTINDILSPIAGYLLSITRNTEGGWYELEIGMPINWVFKENQEIGCEVQSENDNGKLIRIFPKFDDITIDELIKFVIVIIETNKRIKDKELEFQKKIEEFKESLEKEAKQHYTELDQLKDSSFKSLDGALNDVSNTQPEAPKAKTRKPRAKLPPEFDVNSSYHVS